MTNLSPAALAILDAHDIGFSTPGICLAAALRAVADQLSYEDSEGRRFLYVPEILAIAAELEAQ